MASASRALRLARLSAPLRSGGGASSSRLRGPLAGAAGILLPTALRPCSAPARSFSTQPATSSLRDSSPNWSNRPPKETILLDGCDFEHWLVVVDPPPGDPGNPDMLRDDIIAGYIKTLAQVVGSEEEARQKIYSVSTRHYFAFGALVSEELSYKIKELPHVRWVLPDSYLDVKNKDYGGEPFVDGQAVPYDPKYHEEWVRNNARANERSRRNDRPRNFDRSRNFERRRENMQNFQNRDMPPPGQNPMPPRDAPPMNHAPGNMPPPRMPNNGAPPAYQPHAPNPQQGYAPNPQPGYAPNPQPGYAPGGAQNYGQGGAPGYQGGPSAYEGGNQGYQGNPGGPGPAYQSNNPGYQGGGPGYQGAAPPFPGGNPPPYQSGNPPPYQGHVGNPSYQQGGGNYNTGAPAYEGRDGPGKNYQ